MKVISIFCFMLTLIIACPFRKKILGDWIFLGSSHKAITKTNINKRITNLSKASIYSYKEDGTFLFDIGDYKEKGNYEISGNELTEKTWSDTTQFEIILINDTLMSLKQISKLDTLYFYKYLIGKNTKTHPLQKIGKGGF